MFAWRIAADTPSYEADDRSGAGAKSSGGRWNRKGVGMIYASTSRALACLETFVHLDTDGLPLNRYLVEIEIPDGAWDTRTAFDPVTVGWDAEPPGRVSIDWGSDWAASQNSLVAAVPSIVVPEELNVLINPAHDDIDTLRIKKVRKWTYDARLLARRTEPPKSSPPSRDR